MTGQNNLTIKTEFLLYRTDDGSIRIETRMENETVWLTQAQMCELFDKNKRTISEHIRNIFSEGELREEQVVRKFRTTAADGKNYMIAHYNLDVIITEEGLDVLNRIVTTYLEFAELQALNRKPMYMRDWIVKLDDFLKLSGRDILTHAGKISHEKALDKAHQEYGGADLSNLDLSRVVMNGTQCSRFFKGDYLAAHFDGSLLHERTLFPQGHSAFINSVVYSKNGGKILSASSDQNIKEWDVESGQCVKSYKGDPETIENPGSSGKRRIKGDI